MTRAVGSLCDALFAAGVGRLELRTHPDNEPSQRLARAVRLPARRARAEVDLAARPTRRTRSSGRCSRTTRGDRSLIPRASRLLVIPIRFGLGLATLLAAALAGAAWGPALLAFVLGLLGIAFTMLQRPASAVPAARSRATAAPGRRRRGLARAQAFAATLPSTLGVTALAAIALVPRPVLAALLGGVCAGLGLARRCSRSAASTRRSSSTRRATWTIAGSLPRVTEYLAVAAATWGVAMAVSPLLQIRAIVRTSPRAACRSATSRCCSSASSSGSRTGSRCTTRAIIIPNIVAAVVSIATILVSLHYR